MHLDLSKPLLMCTSLPQVQADKKASESQEAKTKQGSVWHSHHSS